MGYGALAQPVIRRYRSLASRVAADRPNLIFGQFGVVVIFALRRIPSTLCDHVVHIVLVCPGEDMSRVFTYEAARTDARKQLVKGVRYPMSDAGLRTAMRRSVTGAGIEHLRFHDLRHTAATRILRESNLRVVQKLLGHSEPSTTAKYAHAQMEDIRAAMDAAGPAKNPAKPPEKEGNELKNKA